MAKCECGRWVKDGECLGVDPETGKLIFKCECGKTVRLYAGG